MVWGSFSASSLYFLPPNETVTANKYLEILQSKLLSTMNIQQVSIFQQDGAPAHTAKIVKKWFIDNNVDVLDWPEIHRT